MKVYLDYAATTPIRKEVLTAVLPYFKNNFGNPSSIHQFGQRARQGIDEARKTIADFLGASPEEIIFTSGATESINLALLGFTSNFTGEKLHIISTSFEHHAVLHTLEYIEKLGLATVTFLKPNKEGLISVNDIKKAIKPETRLVTVMYVNNEIGTIQPIREIGKMLEKINQNRHQKIYFHTDAVQGIGYLQSNVQHLHVDLLSLSGHKIFAPKGVGVLYCKKGTPLRSRIHGGAQEWGLRPGTENITGIIGLGKAVEIIGSRKTEDGRQITKLSDYFTQKVLKEIPQTFLNGSKKSRAPHIVNLYFKDVEGESMVLAMDLEGIACSTGSACTSQSLEPSHVMMAIYDDHLRAAGSIRFSFSSTTTKQEVNYAIGKLKTIVKRLRSISPVGRKEKDVS